jgi:hypothetical protein
MRLTDVEDAPDASPRERTTLNPPETGGPMNAAHLTNVPPYERTFLLHYYRQAGFGAFSVTRASPCGEIVGYRVLNMESPGIELPMLGRTHLPLVHPIAAAGRVTALTFVWGQPEPISGQSTPHIAIEVWPSTSRLSILQRV